MEIFQNARDHQIGLQYIKTVVWQVNKGLELLEMVKYAL